MKQCSSDDAAVADAGAGASVWPRRALRYGLPALAAAALTSAGPDPASAGGGAGPSPPPPAPNRVWGGCELNEEAVTQIRQSIVNTAGFEGGEFGHPDDLEVAFIVVYSLLENDGQKLEVPEGEFTGPILCAGGVVDDGIVNFNVVSTSEDSEIPNSESDALSVNILDLEEALILRYEPNLVGEGGPFTGPPEKRFCHTVDDNTDCFTVFDPFFD